MYKPIKLFQLFVYELLRFGLLYEGVGPSYSGDEVAQHLSIYLLDLLLFFVFLICCLSFLISKLRWLSFGKLLAINLFWLGSAFIFKLHASVIWLLSVLLIFLNTQYCIYSTMLLPFGITYLYVLIYRKTKMTLSIKNPGKKIKS